jgi:hypothetical protein
MRYLLIILCLSMSAFGETFPKISNLKGQMIESLTRSIPVEFTSGEFVNCIHTSVDVAKCDLEGTSLTINNQSATLTKMIHVVFEKGRSRFMFKGVMNKEINGKIQKLPFLFYVLDYAKESDYRAWIDIESLNLQHRMIFVK